MKSKRAILTTVGVVMFFVMAVAILLGYWISGFNFNERSPKAGEVYAVTLVCSTLWSLFGLYIAGIGVTTLLESNE